MWAKKYSDFISSLYKMCDAKACAVVCEMSLTPSSVCCVTFCVTFLPPRGSRMQLIMREAGREGRKAPLVLEGCVAVCPSL